MTHEHICAKMPKGRTAFYIIHGIDDTKGIKITRLNPASSMTQMRMG
jgi:hypothetical protein